MTEDSGLMSIDFLVGFTIFMITFIWVATLIPGLFIGLQSHTIDYDAVAYRTGVILVEDPGATSPFVTDGSPWEFQNVVTGKDNVARFGLAISKETPRILDENKVNRFFCSTAFSYPEDYQKRVIFGDIPYRFNISLKAVGEDIPRSVGDVVPDNYQYGYIRRDVKIKGSSNTTIGNTTITKYGYKNTENVTLNEFRIVINSSHLLKGNVGEIDNPNGDAAYRINPKWDQIIINITDLESTRPSWCQTPPALPAASDTNLTSIKFYQNRWDPLSFRWTPDPWNPTTEILTYEDGNLTPMIPPVDIRDNLTLVFKPGFFSSTDKDGAIFINLTFGMVLNPSCPMPQFGLGRPFLNNTKSGPFNYNYHPANVTQPALTDAVMEVAIW
ncbi:MAG: hypothetical protein Q7U51_04780 [Methanoregula sp.]|nr:hypothetical protein [Methanoregula sp.]